MIHGIAWRYNGWSGIDAEDLENELWIKCTKVILNKGKIIPNYLAKCCYNSALDFCRKAKRKLDRSTTFINQITDVSNENLRDDFESIKTHPHDDILSVIIRELSPERHLFNESMAGTYSVAMNTNEVPSLTISDMLSLFQKGTKEYEYIKLVALYHHIDIPENEGLSFDDVFGDKKYEYEIARALGYSNDMSSGYRNVRDRVRHKLYVNGFYEHLMIPEDDQREF